MKVAFYAEAYSDNKKSDSTCERFDFVGERTNENMRLVAPVAA